MCQAMGDNLRAMPRRRQKKERYIDRWRKQHKMVVFYLKREDYELLEKLASSRNMIVKDFLLKFINDVKAATEKEYERGYAKAVEDFIKNPHYFHHVVRCKHGYKGDIALFEAPCSYCKGPMVFTHKDGNWESEVKPELHDAFRHWYHVKCKESLS